MDGRFAVSGMSAFLKIDGLLRVERLLSTIKPLGFRLDGR